MPMTTVAVDTQLKTRILTSPDELASLATPIAQLRQGAEDTQVWLNQSVIQLWFSHFTHQSPFFVACFDSEERLVALAPLIRQRVQTGGFGRLIQRLQWLGTDPSINDAARILIHPNTPLEPVMQAVTMAMVSASWDMLDLRQWADEAQVKSFTAQMAQRGLALVSEPGQPISWVTLPETVEAYMDTCRTKWLKRDLGRLERHMIRDYPERDFGLQTIGAEASGWGELNQTFFDRQAAYWQARGIRSEQDRFPQLRGFYAALQNAVGDDGHPVALLSELSYGEHWLSTHLLLTSSQTQMSHLTVYNPDFKYYRPGLFHLERLMVGALETGHPRYDLGRGDNQYKSLWKLEMAETTHLTYIRSPWAKLALKADAWLKARRDKQKKAQSE